MAKKFVRGITDVKTINNQDYDTNNVNDLLSDGQYNYIHRKKGKNEEYHNLTDNIKTISSDNTDLLTVTNNNKTTNTATLSPKHDAQKEQLLESTRHTIAINHGENGTDEKTSVDTNPQKVLEHANLISDSEYITLDHKTGTNTTHIKTAALKQELDGLHQTKQDTLTAGDGITIDGQTIDTNPAKVLEHDNLLTINGISKVTEGNVTTIGLKTIDNYAGDLNELTETCQVKPTNDAVNLPVDGYGEGILTVVRIGDIVSQKYHSPSNEVFTRAGEYFDGAWEWMPWTGAGATSTIERYFTQTDWYYKGYKQVVTYGIYTLLTVTFDCDPVFTECNLPADIKRDLEKFVKAGMSVSNGAITITNDGTNIKLIKSGATENVNQQGTFTFFRGGQS